MFIRTAQPLPKGTAVLLELVRPGLKKSIRLSGRVVNVFDVETARSARRLPGMAVAFDLLHPEEEKRLKELLDLLAPGQRWNEPEESASASAPRASPQPPALSGKAVQTPTVPVAAVASAPKRNDGPASGQVMVSVKGLMVELAEKQGKLEALEREVERLRQENTRLKQELARAKR